MLFRSLANEAALLAARLNKKRISFAEFAESIDRVIGGPARKSKVISAREKEIVAYHESGHAIVGHMLANADPVFKVTIVSRGQMGGYTRFLPEGETQLVTQNQLEARLGSAVGGRVAEELVFY